LPQAKGTHFLLGIEVDINMDGARAIDHRGEEEADFIIFAPSHLHMKDFTIPTDFPEDAETHAACYKERLHALLNDNTIPFEKTGLAHFTCGLACTKEPIRVFSLFSDEEYRDIFTKVARRGMGVELNFRSYSYNGKDLQEMLRPFRIAKSVGCKFYCGGDAHHPEDFRGSHRNLSHIVDMLELEESDKFPFIADRIARTDAGEQFLGNRKVEK
jgi:histidinol phosphatase-like PHP family hydrolase